MGELRVTHTFRCRSSPERLWPVVSDTDRLNRVAQNNPVAYSALNESRTAARFVAATKLGPFNVRYEERPFEWVFPKRLSIRRPMLAGAAHSLGMTVELEPKDGGTEVTSTLIIDLKFGVLAPFVRRQMMTNLVRMAAEVQRADEQLLQNQPPRQTTPAPLVDVAAVDRGIEELKRRVDSPAVAKLRGLLVDGADLELLRIRPYVLADEWKLDRAEVLTVALHAVRSGLLDLRWEIVCPSCRVGTETAPTLSALKEHGECQLCELEFQLELDESVEATFAPAPAIREVVVGPFCIGGPNRMPHVLAQVIVGPGATAELSVPAKASGRLRVFARGGAAARVEVDPAGPSSVEVQPGTEEVFRVAPGGLVKVKNASSDERHVKLEQLEFARQSATVRDVTALPAFRREFSKDLLRPGSSMKVGRVTLLFSDLTGSTQLYSDVGDAAAFRLVQDHFDVVIGIIERGRGTLVKTIGDAVMAVFAREDDAVAASVEILRAFEEFRKAGPPRSHTHIKLGIYGGPCYVITANGQLDYFGQSVNIAARLQAQAHSGELVLPADLAERAERESLLGPAVVLERYDAELKGVAGTLPVVRLGLPSAGARRAAGA